MHCVLHTFTHWKTDMDFLEETKLLIFCWIPFQVEAARQSFSCHRSAASHFHGFVEDAFVGIMQDIPALILWSVPDYGRGSTLANEKVCQRKHGFKSVQPCLHVLAAEHFRHHVHTGEAFCSIVLSDVQDASTFHSSRFCRRKFSHSGEHVKITTRSRPMASCKEQSIFVRSLILRSLISSTTRSRSLRDHNTDQ